MKIFGLVVILIMLTHLEANAAVRSWNPCIKAKKQKVYRKLSVDSSGLEACFVSAVKLISTPVTKKRGIDLISKFLYVRNSDYSQGAIIQLGTSGSVKAIPLLKAKGKQAVRKNNKAELELVVSSLVTLRGYSAARELAIYSKKRKKYQMTRVIRNEYLVYTTDKEFEKMEAIAGKVLD